MSNRAAKCMLFSLTTFVVSLALTSCGQLGHIVNTDLISKLSGDDIENSNKSEITILKSGTIIYKDKKFVDKSKSHYNSPEFYSGNTFGPHSITFGPE